MRCRAASATATTAAIASRLTAIIIRRRKLEITAVSEAVADSVNRDNIAVLAVGLDLASQVGDVDVDGAVHAIEVGAKGASQQFLASEYAPRRSGQHFQKAKLCRGKSNRLPTEMHTAAPAVDFQLSHHDRRRRCRLLRRRSPQQGLDAGHHFAWAKRLGDVVVGAEIEPSDPVVFGGSRCEHHYRYRGFLPEALADFVTGDPRNHQVENHEGDIFATRHFEAINAIASHDRFVSGMLEVQLKRVRHDRIVFNDHNPQAIPFRPTEITLVPAIFRYLRQPADQDC